MQLVILAAGHGRRFGGLKQLAPVGPNGEAIMDFTARSALASSYDGIVVIVREEIEEEITAHLRAFWPSELAVEVVCQSPRAGTAPAVASAAPALTGPFGVANADDLYGSEALALLRAHFDDRSDAGASSARHTLVAYRLDQTILSDEPVRRGLCTLAPDGALESIIESDVQMTPEGFLATPRAHPEAGATRTDGGAPVSMNLWGFHLRMLDHLADALAASAAAGEGTELLLSDVVGDLVATGADAFQVHQTTARCLGVTHREDLVVVRAELEREFGAAAADPERSARTAD